MRKVDLETHFATQGWVDALFDNFQKDEYPRFERDRESGNLRLCYRPGACEPCGDAVVAKLLDLGEGRLDQMDAAGIDLAVISLTAPGVEQFEPALAIKLAREANDALAEAIDKHPDRYQGFAALPTQEPAAAAAELERAVRELGLRGWKTHCNYGDSYLDDKRYWPVLAKAEELGIAVYLHPTVPNIPEYWTYGIALAGAPFGFGEATALAMMRLVLSGAFDAFPRLQIILGHYGEGLPFQMHRIDWAFRRPHVKSDKQALVALKKVPSQYLRDNMTVTTSGNYLPAAFKCTREALGMDKIMLGTDHPYEDMTECVEFLESLALSADEKTMLYSANAKRLGIVD